MSRKVNSLEIELVECKGQEVNVIVLDKDDPKPKNLDTSINHVIIRIK